MMEEEAPGDVAVPGQITKTYPKPAPKARRNGMNAASYPLYWGECHIHAL
jgi:hypothetical protein